MELERKNIEAIKYRLEKLDIKASNGDIRVAASDFETLDINAIADKVAHNIRFKSGKLATQNNSITESTKHSLIKIEAAQMDIDLSESEVLQIVNSSSNEISDTAQFIIDTREILREFLYQRNQQLASQNDNLIGTVQQVINEANQEKARIIASTNQSLMDVVEQCRQANEDYKSPYTSRLESMRKTLQSKFSG